MSVTEIDGIQCSTKKHMLEAGMLIPLFITGSLKPVHSANEDTNILSCAAKFSLSATHTKTSF